MKWQSVVRAALAGAIVAAVSVAVPELAVVRAALCPPGAEAPLVALPPPAVPSGS